MNEIQIRRAEAADGPVLTEIALAAKAFWKYPAEWLALWREDLTFTPAYIAEAQVFVAVMEDRVAGVYALVEHSETHMEVDHLWVSPNVIGQGVGRALFDHLLEQARTTGASTLEIASDPNAVGFYERMGARHVRDIPSVPAGRTLPVLELAV